MFTVTVWLSVMRFVIYGDPVPKERPRFNPYSRSVYTPTRTDKTENYIKRTICQVLGRFFDYPLYSLDNPLCVDVDFIFKRPKYLMKKRFPDGLMWYSHVPDKDNLEKLVFDSLNKILWQDDRIIVDGRSRKLYAEKYGESRICINVYPAGDPPVAPCNFPNSEILDRRAGRKRHEDD